MGHLTPQVLTQVSSKPQQAPLPACRGGRSVRNRSRCKPRRRWKKKIKEVVLVSKNKRMNLSLNYEVKMKCAICSKWWLWVNELIQGDSDSVYPSNYTGNLHNQSNVVFSVTKYYNTNVKNAIMCSAVSDEKSESFTLKFTQFQVSEVTTVSSVFIDHFWRPVFYWEVFIIFSLTLM